MDFAVHTNQSALPAQNTPRYLVMHLFDRLFFLVLPCCMALLTAIQDYAMFRRQFVLNRTSRRRATKIPPRPNSARILTFVKPAQPKTVTRVAVLSGRRVPADKSSPAVSPWGQSYCLENCEGNDVRVGSCSIISISHPRRQADRHGR